MLAYFPTPEGLKSAWPSALTCWCGRGRIASTTKTKEYIMTIRSAFQAQLARSKALGKAQEEEAAAKRFRKGLPTPTSEWSYTNATSLSELKVLASFGWEPVSQVNLAPVLGTSILTKTLMRKRNCLDTAA